MQIKISLLNSLLHESNAFSLENQDFINKIEKSLGEEIKVSPLDDYDCDLKLIFIASGGSEGLFLKALSTLKAPYYLLTKGTNNSLAAAMEIMTYLNLHHLPGEILHGDISYIASRIKNLSAKKEDSKTYQRLGVIGKPSDWLIASIPSYDAIKETFQMELVDISLEEVLDLYNKDDSIYQIDANFDSKELSKAEKFYHALSEVVRKYHLDGLTIRCFDLLTRLKSTGCHALARLNDEGIPATCEGDIMALIGMMLIKSKFHKLSFQANPAVIDVGKREVVFAHCTIPYGMCESFQYDTHFESKSGVAIKGELACRKVGVLRIASDLKHYFYQTGVITENLKMSNLCRTQIKIKFDEDISSLLTNPCGNHHLIFYLD